MKPELYWLVLTATMTGLLSVPYILNRIKEIGLDALLNPNANLVPTAAWANRATKAHYNAVENLVVFAPLALAVVIMNAGTALTAQACMVYFFARLAHFVVYAAGIPVLRTVAFFAGLICQMILAYTLLTLAA